MITKIREFIFILINLSVLTNVYANNNISFKQNAPKTHVIKNDKLSKPRLSIKIIKIKSVKADKNIHPQNIKLSPHPYDTTQEYNIPSIPLNLIQNFVEYPKILPQSAVIKSPKIIDSPNNKQLFTIGDIVYATGIDEHSTYLVYRVINNIHSPTNHKDIIGTEVEIIGQVSTLEPNNTDNKFIKNKQNTLQSKENENFTQKGVLNIPTIVATPLIVQKSRTEITSKDKLYKLANNHYERFNFTPHAPENKITAFIFHIYKGFANLETSKFHNIIISGGEKDGIDKGTILSLYKNNPKSKLKVTTDNNLKNKINNQSFKYITYPTYEIGKAMVYHSEQDVSYAIIIESSETIEVGDVASNPGRNLQDLGDVKQFNKFK